MHNILLNYFSTIMPLTHEESAAIAETMLIQEYKKGSILLREGQISKEAYFVIKGCVRQYYLVDGEEKTHNFFTEEQWVVAIKSFSQNTPSTYYLDCCEDSHLVVGNRQKEEDLYRHTGAEICEAPWHQAGPFPKATAVPACQLYRRKARVAQQDQEKTCSKVGEAFLLFRR